MEELIKIEMELNSRNSYLAENELICDSLKLGNIVNAYLKIVTLLEVTNKTINTQFQGFLIGHMCRISKLVDASLLLLEKEKYYDRK